MKKINKTYIMGIFFLLFSAFILYGTTLIQEKLVSNEPGPKFFPTIAALGIIVFSILSMIFDGRKERRESSSTGEAKAKPAQMNKDVLKKMILFFAEMVIFAIGMEFIGYLITSCIMTFVIIWTLKGGKKISIVFSVIFSVLISCIIYFSFIKVFHIPLPSGSIWTALGINISF